MPRRLPGGRPTFSSERSKLIKCLNLLPPSHLLDPHKDIDQIVKHLRYKYPEYARKKLDPFTTFVSQTLNSHFRTKQEEDDDDPSRPKHKTLKRSDIEEARILRHESDFLQRKRQKPSSSSPSSSSIPSSSSSSSSEEDDEENDSSEEEDGAVSTSEDAVFEEPVEPEFDLMKAMLRANYSNSSALKLKDEEEKNVEVEVEDKSKKMEAAVEGVVMMGKRKDGVVLKGRGGGGNGGDLKEGKKGPRFRDLGGIKGVLDELMMEVIVPLYHPQLPRWLGVRPMAGILLHGPPGCGKTKLAHAIANETNVPFYKISATEVVSGVSGASEENIRDLFSKAYRTAPSIVFIDEIDAIASKRENLQREMERRIVTQLMTCMDESHQTLGSDESGSEAETSDKAPGYVLVIGATNRPDAVDPALRRPGRFDREIVLGVPNESARAEILSVLTHSLRLEGTFDLDKIARCTPGFVGADLAALVNKAGNLAMKRIIDRRKCELSKESNAEENSETWWRKPWVPQELESLSITMTDFEEAAKMVQPSSRREGFSAIPNVKWEDVGGLSLLRTEFDRYIVKRIKHPEYYEEFGVDSETGFLLYGPPGCGKTLIAKAVANEAGANFIHIKGPELLNKYVGESELAVRTIFSRARTCAPCILFFDEVDALTTKRGKDGGWVVERLLNQLLIELDGADQRRGVFVIGATNRPEVMDRAVLRPGRFGKLLYVPLPTANERVLILKALARKKPLAGDVNLQAIGESEACQNLSGADLAAVMNEAAMAAVEEKEMTIGEGNPSTGQCLIKTSHFEQALQKVSPSVSEQQKNYYEALSRSFKAA
ncbi:cell division control protein 48 C [Cinnamomum micranthum f. kanehirae]|uniref:Cell division control protein 48 C n=1 Tax=Cinnamomum micranthum f. kanehirae TaxID=337451 RepID=A0A3S3NZJ9_9MAGN|nr:cell division control protein 48 C [Cinnamomum micranthum f. kanehirae]